MNFSIRSKLIVFTFCVVLLVGGSISLYFIYQGRQRILSDFEKDARETTTLISTNIADDLYFLNVHALRLRLESARANPDISYIYVTDSEGVMLADGTQENALRDQKLTDGFSREMLRSDKWISGLEGEILKVGGPVLTPDGSRIGHLQVGFSLAEPERIIRATSKSSLYITLICLGIGAILAFILSTNFSRPILSIVQAAKEIGEGRLDTGLRVNRRDELGTLAESINRMAESLQQRRAETKKVQEELQARYKEMEALYEMGQTVLGSPDLKTVLEKMLDQVLSIFHLDIGNIRMFRSDGSMLIGAYKGYQDPENVRMHLMRVHGSSPKTESLVPKVIASKKSLAVEDVPAVEGMSTFKREGVQSAIIVPIFSQEEGLGIIEVGSRTPRKFHLNESHLLEAIGNQMGVAVQKAQLFEEIQQRARQQEALNAIATATSRSLDLKELFEIALNKTVEVTGRERVNIRLKDPLTGRVELTAHRGFSDGEIEELRRRTPHPMSEEVFASGNPLIINDSGENRSRDVLDRTRSVAWVPIKAGARVVGVLGISDNQSKPFSASEVELLEAIGSVIGVAIENARLFGETKRNLEGIRALHEIDKAITSTLDLHDILAVLLEKIELFLPYSTATIRLLNKESSLLEPVACRNLDEAEWKVAAWKPGRGPANAVFESKTPLVIRNCLEDPRVKDHEFFRKHQLVSYLGVPMFAKEEILGVLSFYTREEHEFTAEEVEFLTTLAGQAAIAIHNARLYEETERRRREAEELARVAQSLTETLDMRAVGERIVTSVRELFGVSASTLRLLQTDGSLRTLASTSEGFSISSGGEVLPGGTGLASVAVAEGKPIWSADVLHEPRIRLTDQMRDHQLRSGDRSMIAVPLRAHEKIIGSLGLADRTGRTYSDSEVALVQTFADQAALALENARLYEEARSREAQLQETNHMLSALHSVAAAASQSLDLDRVLQAAIEKIIDIFRFDATGIYIYDERMKELLLRISLASDRERFTQPQSFTGGQGIAGKVAESGKPLIFEDIEADPLYQQLSRTKSAKQLGHRFFAVFPIKGKLKNVGALTCMGGAPRRLNSNEIQLLEAVTDQIAVAIENSALYEEMVKLAADLSRSNKVKDEFLSVMSHELRTPLNVVMGYTGMIKDRLLGEINPEQEKALEKVISRARDQLTMISSILQATQLEAEGVKAETCEVSLKDFFNDLRSNYAIPFGKELSLVWDYPSDLPVINTDGEKLKHVLQNLINNAIKFTERGAVTISARYLNGASAEEADIHHPEGNSQNGLLQFKVADTGVGIAEDNFSTIFERFRQVDSSETRKYGGVGIGLYIVKKFTELLGGKVELESEEGKGSTFTVTIPGESRQQASKEEPSERVSSR